MIESDKVPGCPICFSPDGKNEWKPPRSVLKLLRHVYEAHEILLFKREWDSITPENASEIILNAWMEKTFGTPKAPPQSGYYKANIIHACKERTRQGLFAIRLDFMLPTDAVISGRFVLGRRKDPDGFSPLALSTSQGFKPLNKILRQLGQNSHVTIGALMDNPELIVGRNVAITVEVTLDRGRMKTKVL